MSIIFLRWLILTPSKIYIRKKFTMTTAVHIIYVIYVFFIFLIFFVREMLSTYANESKLRSLIIKNILQNMSFFVFLIQLDLTYFVLGKCVVWRLFKKLDVLWFVLIFLFPGMD